MTLVSTPYATPGATAGAAPFSRLAQAKDLVLDHEHWNNPRTVSGLSESEIGELEGDIRVRGVQIALVVQKIRLSDGRIVDLVIDGQRRTIAARRINPKMLLPVNDRTPEPIELDWETSDKILTDMLGVASHRAGLSDFELSEVAERMKNRDRNLADIGQAIRKSPSWVSRILTARHNATPKLLVSWKKGEVTTEQFKDLAAEKEPAKQQVQADRVIQASKDGNKGEARALAKETAHHAKAEKAAPVVKGPQLDLIKNDGKNDGKDADAKPARKPVPSRLAMEELVRLTDKRPPTSELVKGIVLGVKYALGDIEQDGFGKAWLAYLSRAGGQTVTKKSVAKPRRAAKPARKAKARKPDKLAQARKVAAARKKSKR